MTTRFATPLDVRALQPLAVRSFLSAYADFNTEENMRNYLAGHFSEEKLLSTIAAGEILLGIEDEKIAAYAQLIVPGTIRIPHHQPLEIARLYTDTSLIGKGFGKQMLEAIDREAHRRGCDSVCLGVWQKNHRAINFYQREGFRIHGLTKFLLGDDLQDDFVMLRPVLSA
jgi:ribosomal protein S18 acetylase RimI-like enzyme